MIIEKIDFSNIKGRSAINRLAPITMFLGKNGAGKSSRMDVIRLALNGYVPNVGARNDAIFKLSSGSVMTFAVKFDVGIITGRWERKAESVSGGRKVPDVFPELPAVLFDPKTYFGLTPDKRIQFAFDAMKISEGAFDTAELLSKLKLIKCDEHSKVHQVVLDDIVKELSDSAAKQKKAKSPIQEWIAAEVTSMQDKLKLARSSCDRMAKTAAGMVELEASGDQIQQNMGNIDSEFDVITTQLADATEQLRKYSTLFESITAATNRKAELKVKLDRLGDIPLRIRTTQAEIDRLKPVVDAFKSRSAEASAALVEAQGKVSAAEAAKTAAEKNLNLAQAGAHAESQKEDKRTKSRRDLAAIPDQSKIILELESNIRRATSEVAEYFSASTAIREKLHEIENGRSIVLEKQTALQRQNEELGRELERFRGLQECPTCFHKGETWKLAALQKMEGQVSDNGAQLSLYEKQLRDAANMRDGVSKEMSASVSEDTRITELNKSVGPMRDKLASAQHLQASRRQTSMVIETLGEAVDFKETVKKLESELTVAKARFQEQARIRELIEQAYDECLKEDSDHLEKVAELSRLNTLLASLQSDSAETIRLNETMASIEIADPKAIQHQVKEAKDRIDVLRKQQEDNRTSSKQCAASLQTLAIREQSVAERRKAEAELEVRKMAMSELQSFRSAMVDTAFKPLLKVANSVVGSFLPAPLEYRNDELGMKRGSSWATDLTFSGAEQAYTFVSLAVALAVNSPFKIILMDMMGEIDATTEFLKHVAKLIEDKVIDQFIGCDRNVDRYDNLQIEGLELIRL